MVGVQKLAAANSNTATRHILQSALYLTAQTAECISLRISDILEYSPTRDAFISSIGRFNVGTLEDIKDMHLYDFGIFIELAPDEEEIQMLENNIQVALSKDQIYLEDAIDIREIKNLKLANQLLKLRRKKKQQTDQEMQQANIKAQADANTQTQQAAAQAEIQKQQAITEQKLQLVQTEAELETRRMETEKQLKKDLMQYEFELNMAIKNREFDAKKETDIYKENSQTQRDKMKFESSGNDTMGSGFNLEQFEPK